MSQIFLIDSALRVRFEVKRRHTADQIAQDTMRTTKNLLSVRPTSLDPYSLSDRTFISAEATFAEASDKHGKMADFQASTEKQGWYIADTKETLAFVSAFLEGYWQQMYQQVFTGSVLKVDPEQVLTLNRPSPVLPHTVLSTCRKKPDDLIFLVVREFKNED